MIIYDRDDKLLCASEKIIRLWDFCDRKEQSPELITACESSIPVERVFVNKNSKSQAGNNLLVVVTNKDEWVLYKGRMDKHKEGNTSMHENQKILCVEFDNENTCFWLGTDKGLLICISVDTGQEIGSAYEVT